MALIRNIAGLHKLGEMGTSYVDHQARILPDDGYGGGGYSDSYANGGGDGWGVPPDVINPDNADTPDVGDVHPVYPIEPVYGHVEPEQEPVVTANTVEVVDTQDQRNIDITAVGAIASILGMALGLRPKGLLGGIMYAGACGLLWMQLHYQTPGLGTDPRKA